MGLTNADVPDEYGGSEMDKISSAIIADQMAKCGSFVVSMGAHSRHRHAAPRLLRHGRAEEEISAASWPRREMIGAYALSESTSGSDAMNSRTRAVFRPMASTTS